RHNVVGQPDGVVPVPAELAGLGSGPVDGGGGERPQVGQRGQQKPLKLLGSDTDPFKQADVLDGDAGSAGQGDDDVLVVEVEGLSVEPFGQVEVTVDLAADADGDAQQGVQVRVAGREPGGGRMGRDVVDPQ